MLTFKQRYKPKTEREYTKSDLTVYDSAGNTALAGLKVYGKSEVVDGEIKSAGEGYAVVDLGTLSYIGGVDGTYGRYYTTSLSTIIKQDEGTLNILCPLFTATTSISDVTDNPNGYMWLSYRGNISFSKNGYADATAFKSAMNGVILAYQLADPTQGNAIAVKTDDGTGIDGTMATFSTGTPLYGVSDTVRDVMVWNGSAGTVTKKCGEVDLGTLNWAKETTVTNVIRFTSTDISASIKRIPATETIKCIMPIFTPSSENLGYAGLVNNAFTVNTIGTISLYNPTEYADYTAEAFATAMSGVMLIYELATPTSEQLTTTENTSIASLRTFDGTTHFTNNAATDMAVNYTIKVPTIS